MPPETSARGNGPLRAIVTGASRGIGQAIAEALADRGMRVTGTSRSGQQSQPEARAQGGSLEIAALDLSDSASVESFASGRPAPDVLVNNAGQSQIGAAEECTAASLRRLFEVNFFGTVDLTRRLIPGMRQRVSEGGGPAWIINVGSLAGRFPVPFQSAYVASKSALAGYTACLRAELKPSGIHVTLLEPADIRTEIEPEHIGPEGTTSPYREPLTTMRSARDRAMGEANPPDQVARLVLRILNSTGRPKPIYPVGGNAPLLCLLKRLLPDALVERLIARRYGLE